MRSVREQPYHCVLVCALVTASAALSASACGSDGEAKPVEDAGVLTEAKAPDAPAGNEPSRDEDFFPGEQADTGVIGFTYPLGRSPASPMLAGRFTRVAGTRSCDDEFLTSACVVHRCKIDSEGSPLREGRVGASAGTVSVSGGNPNFSMELRTTDDFTFANSVAIPNAFDTVNDVRIRASGADVPAFDFSWKYPLVLLLDSPVPTISGSVGSVALDAANDAELRFSRGADDVQLWLYSPLHPTPPNSSIQLDCHFASASGAARVPSAGLAVLPADSELSLATVRRTKLRAGAFEVTLALVADVFTSDRKSVVRLVRK